MLNLNLLPPEEKINLAYTFRRRAVMAVGGGFAAGLVIFLILLLPTLFSLLFQKSEVVRALELERQSQIHAGLDEVVRQIQASNRLVEAVARHQADRRLIAPLFMAVLRDVPPPIRLQAVKFRSETRELTVEGFAPTRSDLLAFLRALEENPRFASISSPVTNLIREADIRFSLVARVE